MAPNLVERGSPSRTPYAELHKQYEQFCTNPAILGNLFKAHSNPPEESGEEFKEYCASLRREREASRLDPVSSCIRTFPLFFFPMVSITTNAKRSPKEGIRTKTTERTGNGVRSIEALPTFRKRGVELKPSMKFMHGFFRPPLT
ncbi:hypothetical protein ABW19_dt0207534 [Dactylella cylindrospora]|nr:hypothetical protein ABW19_dt0207534 [Dactylella cylindrospora]